MRIVVLLAAALVAGLFADQQQVERLLQLHRAEPNNWKVCHQLGLAYTQLEQLDQAAEFYRKAVRLQPQFVPARKNLAVVLWFLNRKQEAAREFTTLEKTIPADPVPHLYLGLASYGRRDFETATIHFEKAGDLAMGNPEVRPAVVESYVGLGEAYDKAGKSERAYAALLKAVELGPLLEETYLSLAIFSMAHRNNEYGLKILNQGLEKIPGSARLLHQRGIALALLGNQEEAERSLRKASEIDPKWSAPRLALGVSQLERGRYEDAAVSFRQAARLAPKDFRAEYLYATALKRTGDPSRRDEAIAALRRATSLKPDDPRPRASLGQTYLEAGKLPEASAELTQAIRIDPRNVTALYQMGLLQRDLGNKEASRQYLKRFEEVKAKKREEEGEMVQILKIVTEK